MFEKLFLLVKNNANGAIINNSAIPLKCHEAVINEASSSIIEVLKDQVETGRLNELIKFFQFEGIYNNMLITNIVGRFANKLINYYEIEPNAALAASKSLISPVMIDLIRESKNEANKDFGLNNLVSKLTGNQLNVNLLVNRMTFA